MSAVVLPNTPRIDAPLASDPKPYHPQGHTQLQAWSGVALSERSSKRSSSYWDRIGSCGFNSQNLGEELGQGKNRLLSSCPECISAL